MNGEGELRKELMRIGIPSYDWHNLGGQVISTFVELPEYTAQCDSLIAKYSDGVIGRVLLGLLWGITAHPQEYDRTTWNMRIAKSASLGLTIPTFRIFFQIENEGQPDEHILLCWIEENSATEEVIDYLM